METDKRLNSDPVSYLGHTSSVYGPVSSWRVGQSLGIDLLLQNSICSFNCIYCQLGDIQVKTLERKIYVPTEQVEKDFKHSRWQEADIITLSGSGEPTLALNIAEVIHFIKEYSAKPVMVLTNGTLLEDAAVRRDLMEADQVAVKLDAATDSGLKQMNRPVAGVTLQSIVAGAVALKRDYPGKMSLQCMFMPTNFAEVDALAALINRINPDEVQLNTPKRPYPLAWHVESRGNHGTLEYPSRKLRVVDELQADEIEERLARQVSVPILSVYKKS
ncbi:MAG: radical SAM protein [Vampirovibrionales bacterium]|nr:radical SAM protein [Vampirovibrionales bacterium]